MQWQELAVSPSSYPVSRITVSQGGAAQRQSNQSMQPTAGPSDA